MSMVLGRISSGGGGGGSEELEKKIMIKNGYGVKYQAVGKYIRP